MFRIGDTIKIALTTTFGIVQVTFIVLGITPNPDRMYVLYAQGKVVVAQYLTDDIWLFSEAIDILEIAVSGTVAHTIIPSETDSKVQQIADKF